MDCSTRLGQFTTTSILALVFLLAIFFISTSETSLYRLAVRATSTSNNFRETYVSVSTIVVFDIFI
jgi:hypothetical protein